MIKIIQLSESLIEEMEFKLDQKSVMMAIHMMEMDVREIEI